MKKFIVHFLISFIYVVNNNVSQADTKYEFRTLKSDKVFVRQGHAFQYPIKFIYPPRPKKLV